MKKKTPGKTYSFDAPASFAFPIRNLKAAHWKASKENYPDRLGITVWTAVKGARPQVIEFAILKKVIETMKVQPGQLNVRVKITYSTAGLVQVKVGSGDQAVISHLTLK